VADVGVRLDGHVERLELTQGVAAVWDLVDRANKYLVEQAPWAIAKDPARRDELASVLYAAAETLRALAILISPVMPGAAERLWEQLGIAEPLHAQRVPADLAWGGLAPGTITTKGGALFPRLDPD
jgi:methionyl-tRNA synthetase